MFRFGKTVLNETANPPLPLPGQKLTIQERLAKGIEPAPIFPFYRCTSAVASLLTASTDVAALRDFKASRPV
jgi:hypothetical protein